MQRVLVLILAVSAAMLSLLPEGGRVCFSGDCVESVRPEADVEEERCACCAEAPSPSEERAALHGNCRCCLHVDLAQPIRDSNDAGAKLVVGVCVAPIDVPLLIEVAPAASRRPTPHDGPPPDPELGGRRTIPLTL